MIKPIGDLCVIAPESESGRVQLIDARTSLRGRIIACGPGLPLSNGDILPMEVREGDIVRIKRGNAIESIFEQKRHWIVKESDILAVEC